MAHALIDEEAERHVIGAAISDAFALDECARLKAEHFGSESHRTLWGAIVGQLDEGLPIDRHTVATRSIAAGADAIQTGEYLRYCETNCPNSEHVLAYADRVRELWSIRMLRGLGDALQVRADAKADPQALADYALHEIETATLPDRRAATFEESVDATYDEVLRCMEEGNARSAINTGWFGLDRVTLGLHRGQVTVVGARTSMGKSAFVLQLAKHVATSSGPVLMFSLEMSRNELILRLMASHAHITMHDLRTGHIPEERRDRLTGARDYLRRLPIRIEDTGDVSLRYVRALARQSCGLSLVVLDYLQIMAISGHKQDTRTRELDEASRRLKNMSGELNVPVIVVSQLSRAVSSREDKKPVLQDLRESGGIEANADNVWFLHSAAYDKTRSADDDSPVGCDVIIAKQRNGPRNIEVPLLWHPRYLTFTDPGTPNDAWWAQ